MTPPPRATSVPPMSFRIEDLMDADRMKNGPMVVFWNQEGYIPCNKPLRYGERPKVPFAVRLRGWRPWRIEIRLAPPEGEDLQAFGHMLIERLDLPKMEGAPGDGDRGIFLPGGVVTPDAGSAIASAASIFKHLGGVEVSAVQVKVEAWT